MERLAVVARLARKNMLRSKLALVSVTLAPARSAASRCPFAEGRGPLDHALSQSGSS
jgi:hypothetical protein